MAHAGVLAAGRCRPARSPFHQSNNEYLPQAQRVTGRVAPEGLAVTQRRDTQIRSPCVGKLLADLPSAERQEMSSGTLHVPC